MATSCGYGPRSPQRGSTARSSSGRQGSAQKSGRPVSETVAAHRWLEEIYDPVVAKIPAGLRGRLAPPEIFHEILEHRWYLSERAGHDIGTRAAARSYFKTVRPN